MPIQLNTVISALDKPTSLAPFFVKDSFDITGRTLMAQNESGRHEAREKFIEEAGTSLFWIGGIPAARWIGGKIANIKSGINSNIHFKRINSDGIQNYFADEIKLDNSTNKKFKTTDIKDINLGGKGGKLDKIKAALKDAKYVPNGTKGAYKKFHIAITAASVLTNLAILCVGLPKLNQYISRKIISKEHKELLNKENTQPAVQTNADDFVSKIEQNESQKKVRFGSLKDLFKVKSLFNWEDMAENAQLNVQSSMLLLDYGISGSRVTFIPRDNNERIENFVKEGGIIFFFYKAGEWIKDKMAIGAKKAFNTPIDLDYKIITDKNFIEKLKGNSDKKELFKFASQKDIDEETKALSNKSKEEIEKIATKLNESNEINIIKFIDNELEIADNANKTDKTKVFKNFTLKEAQKAGLIDVEYDEALGKWIRHSEKYIETDKVATLNKNLIEFWENIAKSGESNIEKIVSKTKRIKTLSVFGNIAICCASLSFILPKIQYAIREHRTKTKIAPGIKVYEDLAQNGKLVV